MRSIRWTPANVLASIAGGLIALLCAAILWLYFLDWNTMRGPVSRYASMRLGREVHINGNLKVHLFSFTPRVSASGVTVANPDWAGQNHAADIPYLAFNFRLFPALFGDWVLRYVHVEKPEIRFLRTEDGRTNWDFGNGNRGADLPPVQHLIIHEGHIVIDDRIRKLLFDGTVSSREDTGGQAAAFELNGNGTLNAKKFTAEVHGGPLIHVDRTKPYHFIADVHAGPTHIAADGAITHPFNLGEFQAAVTLEGQNLSDLYDLTGLAMPRTPPYHLNGTLTRNGAYYEFQNFAGSAGSSDLRGNLSVDASGDLPFLKGAVRSRVLNFTDLGALFGSGPAAVAATGRLLPDVALHVERLRQMNADVTYDADSIRSRDFPLRGLHTHIGLNNAVLTLNPLAFQFAYGRLAGSLQIDARRTVSTTSVDARIRDIELAQFMSKPAAATGTLEARMLLHGSGNSVHAVASTAGGTATFVVPSGTFSKRLAELTGINLINGLLLSSDAERTNLRCAVASFKAESGMLHTSQFLFDTEPVRIEGHGTINLANESLNMVVVGKPKEFRIGRIHAPITVTGSLAHPTVGIKAEQAILQGGLAAALGFLSPIAAILPFVDPGLAKDANCGGLTATAAAQGAPVGHHSSARHHHRRH
ncbi:MAG: AsmA family protein [Alphaproteobacteria bacterium]|nr:AsmA family protein [Alphaproteobacteria bacterium]